MSDTPANATHDPVVANTLYRLYAVAICFFSLKTYVSSYTAQPDLLTSEGAWALHALTLTAGVMIWRGAHPALLGPLGWPRRPRVTCARGRPAPPRRRQALPAEPPAPAFEHGR